MKVWSFLLFIVLTLASTLPSAAQCVPQMSVEDVAVTVRAGTSPTGVEGATRRREHIRITQALANQLCITAANVRADGNRSPQIRVEVTTDPLNPTSTARSSALFTVNAIDTNATTGAALRVEVWGPTGTGDTTNGRIKLFPTSTSAASISGAVATVHRLAPSSTSEVEFHLAGYLNPVVTQHYEEPEDNPGSFQEFVQVGDDHEVAVLVPHGGDIENHIAERIWRLDTYIDMYTNTVPDIWEGAGAWGSGQTFRRWHITSADLSPASFPGLARLTDQAAVSPYAYSVAIHGFDDDDKGIIIGGQANKEEKCYIAEGIRNRLLTRREEVAITIFYEENGQVRAIEIPDSTGRTYPLAAFSDLRGMDVDNIVNRLSPNPNQLPGFGGFQLELSEGLRNDTITDSISTRHELLDATMGAIGKGVGQVYAYHPAAEGACEQFE